MPERRARRFRAYGIGLQKTGTTSMRSVFGYYRSQKYASGEQKRLIADFREGKIDRSVLRASMARRDEKLLEFDATSNNWMFRDLLFEDADARFILTIRDAYSWLDSLLNVLIGGKTGQDFAGPGDLFRRLTGLDMRWFVDAETVLDHAEDVVDAALRVWAVQAETLRLSPPSRTLVVRTNEISSSLDALASFMGVPVGSLCRERTHARPTPTKFDMLARLPASLIEERLAEHDPSGSMARHFPGASLEAFLDRAARPRPTREAAEPPRLDEVRAVLDGPSRHLYPVGYWLAQAHTAWNAGDTALAEACLDVAESEPLEADEQARRDGLRSAIAAVRPRLAPERTSIEKAPHELDVALGAARTLEASGTLAATGYRLLSAEIDAYGRVPRGLLAFAHGERRFEIDVTVRTPNARVWVGSAHFAVSHRAETPPVMPSDRNLVERLLEACERTLSA